MDSNAFPTGGGSGGSWSASITSAALHGFCVAVIERTGGGAEATGSTPARGTLDNCPEGSGRIRGPRVMAIAVHRFTGEVRLRRMLDAFAAGRILNSLTARSRLMGDVTWGLATVFFEAGPPGGSVRMVVHGRPLACRGGAFGGQLSESALRPDGIVEAPPPFDGDLRVAMLRNSHLRHDFPFPR